MSLAHRSRRPAPPPGHPDFTIDGWPGGGAGRRRNSTRPHRVAVVRAKRPKKTGPGHRMPGPGSPPLRRVPVKLQGQSSRCVRSMRSWRSWASSERVAIGRASRRLRLIGSAGLLAIAVGPLFDPAQRIVDLGDQLALPIAGPQLQRAIGFQGRTIRQIGLVGAGLLEMMNGVVGFLEDLGTPGKQLVAKILLHRSIHEGFVV